jgi:hypothetical protein
MALTLWEYKTFTSTMSRIESELNSLGLSGWELVGININMAFPDSSVHIVLKRERR